MDFGKAAKMTEQERATEVLRRLATSYPDARSSLDYVSAWELLVATVLSAQCTDERVNMVTPALFSKYPSVRAFADAPLEELETAIKSTGFYRNKAKNLQGAAKKLLADFYGDVPRTMEDLLTLPGVARKTANCVLGNAFGIMDGIAVDTHVGRLAQRLGFTERSDPVKIEQDLMGTLPRDSWLAANHLLIYHGRAVCQARKPLCESCTLYDICPRRGVAPALSR
jgi:endonuclease-3